MRDEGPLERDIEQSHAELAGILQALDGRLSFFRMIDEVVAMISSRPTKDIVRDHALPLGVIGIGVGWLAARALTAPEEVSPRDGMMEKAVQGAGAMARTAGDLASDLRERGEEGAAVVGTLLREHPLAVGVFAAVAGVALGALVSTARNGLGSSGKTKH